jgi:hypothetical protein
VTAILGWLVGIIVQPALSWIWDKIASLILWGSKVYARKRSEEKANEAVGEDMKNANTKEERDDAAKSVLDNF